MQLSSQKEGKSTSLEHFCTEALEQVYMFGFLNQILIKTLLSQYTHLDSTICDTHVKPNGVDARKSLARIKLAVERH